MELLALNWGILAISVWGSQLPLVLTMIENSANLALLVSFQVLPPHHETQLLHFHYHNATRCLHQNAVGNNMTVMKAWCFLGDRLDCIELSLLFFTAVWSRGYYSDCSWCMNNSRVPIYTIKFPGSEIVRSANNFMTKIACLKVKLWSLRMIFGLLIYSWMYSSSNIWARVYKSSWTFHLHLLSICLYITMAERR